MRQSKQKHEMQVAHPGHSPAPSVSVSVPASSSAPLLTLDSPGEDESSVWRAVVTLFALVAVSGITIVLLSAPAKRHVYITAVVPFFPLPSDMVLDMPEVDQMHFWSPELSLKQITAYRVMNEPAMENPRQDSSITIRQAPGVPPASVYVTEHGRRGPLRLLLPKDTRIIARRTTNELLNLIVQPSTNRPMVFSAMADVISIPEADRVVIIRVNGRR